MLTKLHFSHSVRNMVQWFDDAVSMSVSFNEDQTPSYKTIFMLNSTEHENSTAHKNINAEK